MDDRKTTEQTDQPQPKADAVEAAPPALTAGELRIRHAELDLREAVGLKGMADCERAEADLHVRLEMATSDQDRGVIKVSIAKARAQYYDRRVELHELRIAMAEVRLHMTRLAEAEAEKKAKG